MLALATHALSHLAHALDNNAVQVFVSLLAQWWVGQ